MNMMRKQSWKTEPIAIIGTGCRLPGGANSASKLWQVLRDAPDLRKEIPLSKFQQKAFHHVDGAKHGTSNVSHSYVLDEDPGLFDYGFFNLNPKEAESMDPSQRILLETVYEGIEAAGYAMSQLRGSSTGVFVGQMTDDYYDLINRDVQCAPQYTATGSSRSIVANRVSYFFDWRGPSVNLDTACSSSLVALHQAVQALRNGESSLAVAAGVNLILGPEKYIYESQLSMLSPTGRSRMWDVDADGYARGEGFVAVVLKPLSQALADNDHVECIIRETGVNQDGRSDGLTVPNPAAQSSLIHSTYERCGLDWREAADQCQYFEAHGTGTQAGDPKEARAIRDAFFASHDQALGDQVLHVGSVKTVIGHLEGAAGLAGLLKASLAIQRSQIPPNLHFKRLNPKVEPFYGHLKVPTEVTPWPSTPEGIPRRASINSFGFGGTNAHAIIESWDPSDTDNNCVKDSAQETTQHYGPFTVSAGSNEGLKDAIVALSQSIQADSSINLRDLAWTLQTRREHFPVRAAFSAKDKDELVERLNAASKDANAISMQSTKAVRVSDSYPPRILGIFTGQGAQWATMGAGLYEKSAAFRQSIETLQHSLNTVADPPSWTIKSELLADSEHSRLGLAEIAQPLCTAVQVALVDLLTASGISFHGVVGHSSGEIAAAYAAGYINAKDAIRIAYYRGFHSHLSSSSTGQPGKMMAVGLSFQDAETFCSRPQFAGRIQVAASNARSSVTVSGDADAIQEAKAVLDEEKVFARALLVDKAYHSHHMKACSGPYLESLQACGISVGRRSAEGDCIWFSSVHGSSGRFTHEPDTLAGQYWVDNLVSPVMFSQALDRAVQESQRLDLVIEVGPHPALRGPASDLIKSITGSALPYSGVLKRNENDLVAFSDALGFAWRNIDWPRHRFPDLQAFSQACETEPALFRPRVCKSLPTFPWNHGNPSMLWESRASKLWRGRPEPEHELLGVPTVSGDRQEVRWRKVMRVKEMEWLRGHMFQNQVLFPAAGYVSMAIEAASYLAPDAQKVIELSDIQIHRAISLPEQSSTGTEVIFTIRTRSQTSSTIIADYSCFSVEADAGVDEQDACNFTGSATIILNNMSEAEGLRPSRSAPDLPLTEVALDQFYSGVSDIGLDYSGDFLAKSIQRRLGFATVSMNQHARLNFRMDPAVLDASFHGVFSAFCYPSDGRMWTAYLPTSIRRVRVTPASAKAQNRQEREFVADCTLCEASDKFIRADVDIYSTEEGGLEAQFEGLVCTSFKTQAPDEDRKLFARTVWRKDLSAGIENNLLIKASHDDVRLYEVLERTSYFFLRRLKGEISASEIEAMPWNFRASLGWAFDRLLPSIEQGKHPRVQPAWETDEAHDIEAWLKEFPDDISLRAVHAIGQAYPEIVRGTVPALQVLMADNVLDRLYKDCIGGQTANTQVGELVGQLAHRFPHMNILEIGAGTGGTTTTALRCLKDSFDSYVYTDISPGFFEKAAANFSSYAHKMLFKTLDVERDPVEQGFEEHSFDVIMAANVLHATKSLETTIANCHKLLRPGGKMILLEITSEALWIQTIFSALPGWWLGQEEGRINHPTVSIDEWNTMLRRQGFSGVDVECRDSVDVEKYTFSVFTTEALDERVSILRSPLSVPPTESLSPKIGHLAVILPQKPGDYAGFAPELEMLLSPYAASVTMVNGLEDPYLSEGKLPFGSAVISLTDLQEATFRYMNETKFQSIKTIFDYSKHILWTTKGCFVDDPYANIMVGLGRSVMQELTHICVQFIEMDPATTERPAHVLANALLRMVFADDDQFEDVLWSAETEVAVQGEDFYIPRILPEDAPNQRANSGKRVIQSQVTPTRIPVTLKRESPSGVFTLEQAMNRNSGSPENAASTQVEVTASSIFPVLTKEGEIRFICCGTSVESGKPVLAFAPTNSSVVSVFNSDLVELDSLSNRDSEDDLVRQALTYLICVNSLRLLENSGLTMWLHDSDPSVADMASKMAQTYGVDLFWSASSSVKIIDGNKRPRVFHPFITERELRDQLPSNVRCLLTTGAEPISGYHQRLTSCLGDNVEARHLASEASQTGHLPLTLSLESARECLKASIETATTQSDTPKLPVDQLPTNRATAPHFSPPLEAVNWSSVERVNAVVKPLDTRSMFSPNKTYFLVGLTGDVGFSLCDWMIDNGARHLALSSRKPAVHDSLMQAWRRKGANVRVFALDVSDESMLKDVHHQIVETMPPIAGVMNAAMVLRDCPFSAMTWENFDAVLRPKVQGSEYLDKIFYSDDLEFFVLFSSLSRVIGNPGQSSYAGANMFMASLASQRRARGVSASVVDIAMLVGFGWMWRNASEILEEQMKQAAYMSISEPEFHTIMAEAIEAGRGDGVREPEVHTGLATSSTASWKRFPRFWHFVPAENQVVAVGSTGRESELTVQQQIAEAASDEDIITAIETAFSRKLRLVLLLADTGSPIDPKTALLSLGIDSLVAVEIRSWFLKELAVEIPTLRILSDATIEDISMEVKSKLGIAPSKSASPPDTKPAAEEKGPRLETSAQRQAETPPQQDSTNTMNSTAPPSSAPSSPVDDATSDSSESAATSLKASQVVGVETKTPAFERTGDMSFSQESLHFLHEYLADKSSQNVTFYGRYPHRLDIDKLEGVLQQLGMRHEALRSAYFVDPLTNRATQAVRSESGIALVHKQIKDEADVESEVQRLRKHTFDIESGEVMVVTVMSMSPDIHYIVFVHHHIALDAPASVVFLTELALLFAGRPLEKSAPQAIDICARQRAESTSGNLASKLSYWKKMHEKPLVSLPLFPFAKTKSRKPLQEYDTETFDVNLDAATCSAIRKKASELRITPFHFFLASFTSLLARCLGTNDDFNIGIVDSNRSSDISETQALGCYLNLLPLRFRVGSEEKFESLAQRTRDTALAALSNAGVPFDMLLDHLKVTRHSTHHPVFQVLVNYRLGIPDSSPFGDGNIEWKGAIPPKNAYDLGVDISDTPRGGCILSFTTQKYLYSAEDTKLLMKWYTHVLKTFAQDSASFITRCPLASESEMREATALGCGPAIDIPWEGTLIHKVESVAAECPDSIAIKDDEGRVVTYSEMIDSVDALCRGLQARNMPPGSRVAMLINPGIDAICTLLAVLRSGLVWVPLDLRNHQQRLAAIIADCQPQLVVYASDTQTHVDELVSTYPGAGSLMSVQTDELRHQASSSSSTNLSQPKADATLLYTSGSTGIPKGVRLTHAGLLNQIFVSKLTVGAEREVVLQQTSYGFDMAQDQIFQALIGGGTLVIVGQQGRGDPEHLCRVMLSEGVTYTQIVPSEYYLMFRYGSELLRQCHQWRIGHAAGEKFTHHLRRGFQSLGLPNLRLINSYGPTETTITCARGFTPYQTENEVMTDKDCLRTLPNYRITVVDEHMKPVPSGFPGEVCISSPFGISPGYNNNEGETALRFFDAGLIHGNVESGVPAYRTGDLGRFSSETGNLTILGRIQGEDSQVKIRGQRVELDEITASIIRCSKNIISNAAVSWRADSEALVVLVVLAQGVSQGDKTWAKQELRNELPLPPYMRPSVWIPVSGIPTNANGKADRRAIDEYPIPLSEMPKTKAPRSAGSQEDTLSGLSETERQLAKIWARVLGEEKLAGLTGSDSDFFHLGGNSKNLIELRFLLEREFASARIKLPDLFQRSSLGEMASLFDKSSNVHGVGGANDRVAKMDWNKEIAEVYEELQAQMNQIRSTSPVDGSDKREAEPNNLVVVLTGATGFLGRAILQNLVHNARVREVHCIAVRPASDRATRVPIESEKVIEHAGHLESPRLGLSEAEFSHLSNHTDLIIHNGAEVSFLKPYQSLRQANVASTKELSLLAIRRLIPMHFVSTGSVALVPTVSSYDAEQSAPPTLSEQSAADRMPEPESQNGYRDSKWVAERLLETLGDERGLPVYIHRPTSIVGEGAPKLDMMASILNISRGLGKVPALENKLEGHLDLVSVQEVSIRLASIALTSASGTTSPGSATTRFVHHCSPNKLPPGQLKTYLEKQGENATSLELVEFEIWLQDAARAGMDPLINDFLANAFADGRKVRMPSLI